MHVTGNHTIFTNFSVSSPCLACGQILTLVPTVCYFISICVILTRIVPPLPPRRFSTRGAFSARKIMKIVYWRGHMTTRGTC